MKLLFFEKLNEHAVKQKCKNKKLYTVNFQYWNFKILFSFFVEMMIYKNDISQQI